MWVHPVPHSLALSIAPHTLQTSSKTPPWRGEALGVGCDLIGVLGRRNVLLQERVSWEWVASRKWGWGSEAGSPRQVQV